MNSIDRGDDRDERDALDPEQDQQHEDAYLTAIKDVRALVIVPVLPRRGSRGQKRDIQGEGPDTGVSPVGASPVRTSEARLEEAIGLARAIDLDVRHADVVKIHTIRPATLFGTGKVKEIEGLIAAEDVELVVVDQALTPIQQRNLEKAWNAKVVDRTGLILEIFGERARTKEGRLQVELAHLNWQKSRLVRSWTHLERQRGGLGFVGGPGETQIEADRRLIQERITKLEKELDQVRRTRNLHRSARKKVPQPIVALVGYTNAGKSSLFNQLTESTVFAKDLLFATLDPTLRRIKLPHGMEIILSDTVGFISDLPTHLIAAFRATLEEVLEADLVLHVRDIAHEDTAAQAADVEQTLKMLGLTMAQEGRVVEVWNKIDLLADDHRATLLEKNASGEGPVALSAISCEGIGDLLGRIEAIMTKDRDVVSLTLPAADGEALAWVYRSAEVLERHESEAGDIDLVVRVPKKTTDVFRERFKGKLVA